MTKKLSGWAKPPAHEYQLPLVFEDTDDKWLLYDSRVYRVGAMHPIDFENMVRSHCTNTTMAKEILGGIDEFDKNAHWFCLLELLSSVTGTRSTTAGKRLRQRWRWQRD
jgi:hypothetical protein